MNIQLYQNISENASVYKSLEELSEISGTLKEETSIIDPVIMVSDANETALSANYAYIPEFGRYYFIKNIESVRTNLWRIYMHVDVLYTYRDYITANKAIIERNELEYDLLLNDGLFQTQQNPRIAQFQFPDGFNTWNFVLAVAGN